MKQHWNNNIDISSHIKFSALRYDTLNIKFIYSKKI